jgi:PadR family transcriptional regulator PadR
MTKPADLVQGTLDLLILRTLTLQPMHGWGIAQRIRQVSKEVLQVNQGALYPALHPNGESRKTIAAPNFIR